MPPAQSFLDLTSPLFVQERIELEIQAGTDEKQQQDRRAEIVELAEQVGVVRQIQIDNAHGHAAEQRRDVHRRANAAKSEQHRNRNDQPVVT